MNTRYLKKTLGIIAGFSPVFIFTTLFLMGGNSTQVLAGNPGEPPGVYNPLSGISDIPSLIAAVVDAIKKIGYYVVVVFIIYSGFLFVKARGNEKDLEKAKSALLYTFIGAVILLGASILSEVIKNTIDQVNKKKGDSSSSLIIINHTYL
jgi:ABC-type amino acid transport system permease subunit